MLDEMGPHAPTGIGRTEFAECLRHLNDEHRGIALAHIRRALKGEPQNPLFLSYSGMLCAVVEKRYVAGEKLFVDYSGKRPCIWDPRTGDQIEVELFVAVLGAF